jgi:hypothetical protein
LAAAPDFIAWNFLHQPVRQSFALPANCIHRESDFCEALQQLEKFFRGHLRQFTVPLTPMGTAFQQKVWQQLLQVPWGATASYGEIATAIGQPTASRGGRTCKFPQSPADSDSLSQDHRSPAVADGLQRGP